MLKSKFNCHMSVMKTLCRIREYRRHAKSMPYSLHAATRIAEHSARHHTNSIPTTAIIALGLEG